MDNEDRTCSTLFEIPDDVLSMLRRAADYGFALVADPMGDWDANGRGRARALTAARTVDLFRFGKPDARDVAELADQALRWAERPDAMPTNEEQLEEHLARLDELRSLINIRDDALRHIGRPVPDDDADDEAGA